MKIELTREDCYCGLPKFYETVAKKMGVVITDSTSFDCRKICVTKNVQDELWAYYYEEEGYANLQISALFLNVGPKANLEDPDLYLAETEDGFVTE